MIDEIQKEGRSLINNMKETSKEAIYGPVGMVSNPLRFIFYATVLGASQLLIFQVINGSINRAMDK
tara:strand:- start:9793 stop:9990 length:198 start_codon:yes stop_codon:yes gene_type:complete